MFYSINNINESANFLSDVSENVESKYEPTYEGALMNVYESEKNWATMMEAVGVQELNYFIENKKEMVYEGVTASGFFSKLKELFKKMWEKIKGLFNKFFGMINSLIMSDKDFVKKYSTALSRVDTKNFEYKGFVFTKLEKDMSAIFNGIDITAESVSGLAKDSDVAAIKAKSEALSSKKDDAAEEFRGKCVEKSKVEAGEFGKDLYEYFRNNESKPDTLTTVNVNELTKTISDSAESIKTAKKDMKDFEKTINDVIKTIDKFEKEIGKFDNADTAGERSNRGVLTNYASRLADDWKTKLNIAQQFSGAKLSALKARNRQAKNVCVKLLSYKPKNESVNLSSYGEGSLLDQVNFI